MTTERKRFITRDEIQLVINACPNQDWRTIVALCRYGGLRCPSEVLSLRWQDVNWENGRIVVTSPKTEHHPGKGTRTIPLLPELREVLQDAFELAPEGAEFVVDGKFRASANGPRGWANANLRTTFGKIVRRAGLTPWPKLFHNMRASRETELVERYPVQVVTSWLGNTPSIAMKHYLMTTEEHFKTAIQCCEEVPVPKPEAAQNAAQQVLAARSNGSQAATTAHEKTRELRAKAAICEMVHDGGVEDRGLEPTPNSPTNSPVDQLSGAQSGALESSCSLAQELQTLIDTWPQLPNVVRAGILATVRAVANTSTDPGRDD